MDDPVTRIQKLEYRVTMLEDNSLKANNRFNALLDMICEAKQEAQEEAGEEPAARVVHLSQQTRIPKSL